ncbi:MAG: hypothetical protein ACTSU5_12100 [Promethearchaeota archaeon]
MGFLFSYLMCLLVPLRVQFKYSTRRVRDNVTYVTTRGAAFLVAIWVVDALVLAGVLDPVLSLLNGLPGVDLPAEDTGLHYFFSCFLLGFVDLGISAAPTTGYYVLGAVIMWTYIPLYRYGLGWGKIIFGKRASQHGVGPLMTPLKKPANWREMEANWRASESTRENDEKESDRIIAECLELAEKVGLKDKIKEFAR